MATQKMAFMYAINQGSSIASGQSGTTSLHALHTTPNRPTYAKPNQSPSHATKSLPVNNWWAVSVDRPKPRPAIRRDSGSEEEISSRGDGSSGHLNGTESTFLSCNSSGFDFDVGVGGDVSADDSNQSERSTIISSKQTGGQVTELEEMVQKGGHC
jgi:hypothetical protein